FLGVAVYYVLAVLRPQYMWAWSLPPGVPWSLIVALATIAAAVFSAGTRKGPAGRITPAHGLVLAFGAWIGLTTALAHNRDAAYPWFVEYAKIFLMFAVSMLLIRTVRQVWVLFCLMALSLGYIAYEINALYLTQGFLGIQRDGYGGFDNNVAGLMLAMGVPMCYFAWEGGRSRFRWVFLILIPPLLHAVLMTYSRGAMVSLIAVTPLVGVRSRYRGAFALVALGLLALLPFLAGPEIRERFFSIQSHQQDESAQLRRASWAAGWNIALDHPIFGVGVRNANLFSHMYGADAEGRTIHSQYLQIAADNGFVGLGLYLGVLATAWSSLRRVRREAARDPGPGGRQGLALVSG
ncbi:MAG: O-antigen ligase family protein, partial [Nevskiales bacterium]